MQDVFGFPLASAGVNALGGYAPILGAVWVGGQPRYETQVREASDVIIVRRKRSYRIIECSSYR
jgi:hypothetical protein